MKFRLTPSRKLNLMKLPFLAYGLITTIKNKMLAINVPAKMIAGAGLFSSTDSLRRSSKDLNPNIRNASATNAKDTKTMIGPQKAIMLMILGSTPIKLFHDSGAATYETICPMASAMSMPKKKRFDLLPI
jgi:hypothetical protein